MTRQVVRCHADDTLAEVWSAMKEKGFVSIPVVDRENRPVGVLTAREVLQALLREAEYEDSLLRDYVMGIGYR